MKAMEVSAQSKSSASSGKIQTAQSLKSWASAVFRFLSSLNLAVTVIFSLVIALSAATFTESLYDTPTAQYWVYRSTWFYGILTLLGVNILCVALSRLPWKKRHTPFLMAHAGILILLYGAWLTDVAGLDGSLRIKEGETGTVVETSTPELVLREGENVKSRPLKWQPPSVKFDPIELKEYGIIVDQFLSHADAVYDFLPNDMRTQGFPAAKIKIVGGPMKIVQDFWLWAGDPSWKNIQAGPALLSIQGISPAEPKTSAAVHRIGRPEFMLSMAANGDVSYEAVSSAGDSRKGTFKAAQVEGQKIEPGWKGGVQLTIEKWMPNAQPKVSYKPSEVQYGDQAPSSAIHVSAGAGVGVTDIWLGLGDRAVLELKGPSGSPDGSRNIGIGYYPHRVVLPYGIRLDRFTITHYDGTRDPASYASLVSVMDSESNREHLDISMNEPIKHKGITFYQASYEDAQPRPTVSILSVNRDPGRPFKYLGSLLLVLGSILLFAVKVYKKRVSQLGVNPLKAATNPAGT